VQMSNENYEKAVAQFIAVLFHAGTITHFMHLQTKSYAQHKALGHFYNDVIELADKYAEAYQGCYDVISKYPTDFHMATDPLAYLRKLKAYVEAAAKTLPDEANLVNTHADILDLIDSTIYKIRDLK
jgi:hypothetical protein